MTHIEFQLWLIIGLLIGLIAVEIIKIGAGR